MSGVGRAGTATEDNDEPSVVNPGCLIVDKPGAEQTPASSWIKREEKPI